MQTEVSIAACGAYEAAECRKALEEVLAPLGGLDWVEKGMRVVIKANLVAPMKPEQAATTNPVLLCALTDMLKERGADVLIGDSPGGLYNALYLGKVYDATGLRACEEHGARLNQNFGTVETDDPAAVSAKHFTYTGYLDDADAIIDFCKLKSHGMMGMSCAAKNYFGVIPGTMKPEYHNRYPKTEDFANMLVDLAEHFAPRLVLCDAVVGMEGNGPTAGTPRKLGALIAGTSPHKVDLLCAKLIGLNAEDVPTLAAALNRGLIPQTAEELAVSGDAAPFLQPDFDTPKAQGTTKLRFSNNWLLEQIAGVVVSGALTPRPSVQKDVCVGCGKCASLCPAKAITMKKKLPKIARKKCIHCFCCQEFCPKGAMIVSRTKIAKLLSK